MLMMYKATTMKMNKKKLSLDPILNNDAVNLLYQVWVIVPKYGINC